MGYWEDKLVVVVGGSAGFGKVLASELLAADAIVVIAARAPERLALITEELKNQGRISSISLDACNFDSVQAAFAKLVDSHARIDAVFNCVGKSTRESVLDVDVEKIDLMMKVNLNTAVNIARASVPELAKSNGHLVNIGSLASKTAWPFVTSYALSKSAMATYTHQLRLEGPSEVHYLLVCPGPISRPDEGSRYDAESSPLPEHARAGGAGAKIKGIRAEGLARKIMKACVKRKRELIVPAYARIAFIASAISPRLGDWILRRKMGK